MVLVQRPFDALGPKGLIQFILRMKSISLVFQRVLSQFLLSETRRSADLDPFPAVGVVCQIAAFPLLRESRNAEDSLRDPKEEVGPSILCIGRTRSSVSEEERSASFIS